MSIQIPTQRIIIGRRTTALLDNPTPGLVLTVKDSNALSVDLVIGFPGLPNLCRKFSLGDAALYETPNGMFEIRVMFFDFFEVVVLVSLISPQFGFKAGFVSDDPTNTPFNSYEIQHIKEGLKTVAPKLAKRKDISKEHLDIIARKMDEMIEATNRLGRTDWLIFVTGNLTMLVANSRLSNDIAQDLFQTVQNAISWAFQNLITFIA